MGHLQKTSWRRPSTSPALAPIGSSGRAQGPQTLDGRLVAWRCWLCLLFTISSAGILASLVLGWTAGFFCDFLVALVVRFCNDGLSGVQSAQGESKTACYLLLQLPTTAAAILPALPSLAHFTLLSLPSSSSYHIILYYLVQPLTSFLLRRSNAMAGQTDVATASVSSSTASATMASLPAEQRPCP